MQVKPLYEFLTSSFPKVSFDYPPSNMYISTNDLSNLDLRDHQAGALGKSAIQNRQGRAEKQAPLADYTGGG
jgi:hypothetical protein